MASESTAPSPLLVMRGVQKRFGATLALRGVDLAVAPGQRLRPHRGPTRSTPAPSGWA